MLNYLVRTVLFAAIGALLASTWIVSRVRAIVYRRELRAAWTGLGVMLMLTVGGCLLFQQLNRAGGELHHEHWLVASTLMVAALFILGVCAISLYTAEDLTRIDSLERAAFYDPLTQVYSRGHIDSLLASECRKCAESDCNLAVMLLDIDDFKTVNDTLGHGAGDSVLKTLGGILRQSFDPLWLSGRYGGEEFLIVCPKTSLATALEAAERIRTIISATTIVHETSSLSVTVSIGVHGTMSCHRTSECLVGEADLALYQAKRQGRNRVVARGQLKDLQSTSAISSDVLQL